MSVSEDLIVKRDKIISEERKKFVIEGLEMAAKIVDGFKNTKCQNGMLLNDGYDRDRAIARTIRAAMDKI